MDRETWRLLVHEVTKSWTQLRDKHFHLKKKKKKKNLMHIFFFALNNLLGSAPRDQLTQMPYWVFKFEAHRGLF